jgi:hypothetical protein
MGNKLVFGDGITNNVKTITKKNINLFIQSKIYSHKTPNEQTMYLKLPQVVYFWFYVKPEVFLGFDTTKRFRVVLSVPKLAN